MSNDDFCADARRAYLNYLNYLKALKEVAGKDIVPFVNTAVELSYHDPDGAWSDLSDLAGIDLPFEDVHRLCGLYARLVRARAKEDA